MDKEFFSAQSFKSIQSTLTKVIEVLPQAIMVLLEKEFRNPKIQNKAFHQSILSGRELHEIECFIVEENDLLES